MEALGDSTRVTIGNSLECQICGQHFTTAIRRQQHMTFHRPRNLMCYSCKDVEIQFPCYSAMVQHMMTGCGNVNSRELDFLVSCWYQWNRVMIPEVRRKLRFKQDLAPATGYDYDKTMEKYFCLVCDKVFKLEKGAQMHAASNIHNPNIYRCPACKGEFPSFGALLLHAESLKCSLVIKLDSTLAKLLHFLHLKLSPNLVDKVIEEDLGVLVSQVSPPSGPPSGPPTTGPSTNGPPTSSPTTVVLPSEPLDLIDLASVLEDEQVVGVTDISTPSTEEQEFVSESNLSSDPDLEVTTRENPEI